jgi:hypothetical protein
MATWAGQVVGMLSDFYVLLRLSNPAADDTYVVADLSSLVNPGPSPGPRQAGFVMADRDLSGDLEWPAPTEAP